MAKNLDVVGQPPKMGEAFDVKAFVKNLLRP
jgi:hypothetical protein